MLRALALWCGVVCIADPWHGNLAGLAAALTQLQGCWAVHGPEGDGGGGILLR